MRTVTTDELTTFTSPYLANGYKNDELLLEEARFTDAGIVGTFGLGEYFVPPDGVFHFTLLLAFVGVAQLAIIFAHIESGLTKRHGEVLLTKLDLKCRRLITDTSGLTISLRLKTKKELENAAFYSGEIDICDGAFAGEGEFYFPLPEREGR
jgi:hypothetical protein